jgi:hypothetical protein
MMNKNTKGKKSQNSCNRILKSWTGFLNRISIYELHKGASSWHYHNAYNILWSSLFLSTLAHPPSLQCLVSFIYAIFIHTHNAHKAYQLPSLPPFPIPFLASPQQSLFYIHVFFLLLFIDTTYYKKHGVFVFLSLVYLYKHCNRYFHPLLYKQPNFLVYVWTVLHSVYIFLAYSSVVGHLHWFLWLVL